MKRFFRAATCLSAMLLVGNAHAATFKWANDGDMRAMDPYTFNETVQNTFLENIYEPLVRHNKQLGAEPALAASWEQTSPVIWRFHLRQGVKWQDGSPMTAIPNYARTNRVGAPQEYPSDDEINYAPGTTTGAGTTTPSGSVKTATPPTPVIVNANAGAGVTTPAKRPGRPTPAIESKVWI